MEFPYIYDGLIEMLEEEEFPDVIPCQDGDEMDAFCRDSRRCVPMTGRIGWIKRKYNRRLRKANQVRLNS